MLLVAALLASACGNDSSTSPSSTTTGPSTEYFTGTLSPKTSQFYSFTVTTAGAVAVTLASDSATRIGAAGTESLMLGLGVPSGFGCSATSSGPATPALNAQLTSASSATGIYCVSVADPGTLTGDTLFVIRIVHT